MLDLSTNNQEDMNDEGKAPINTDLWSGRKEARRQALQILYQLHCSPKEQSINDFIKDKKHLVSKTGRPYLYRLSYGIFYSRNILNHILQKYIKEELKNINVVNLILLQLGTYEIVELKTTATIVINEYVHLAKEFGPDQGFTIVNAVLDQVSKNF